MFTNIDLFVF